MECDPCKLRLGACYLLQATRPAEAAAGLTKKQGGEVPTATPPGSGGRNISSLFPRGERPSNANSRTAAECLEVSSSRARQTDPRGASEAAAAAEAESSEGRRWAGGPVLLTERSMGGAGSEARLPAWSKEARGEGAAGCFGEARAGRAGDSLMDAGLALDGVWEGVSRLLRCGRVGDSSNSSMASAMLVSRMTGDDRGAGEDWCFAGVFRALAVPGRAGVTAAFAAAGDAAPLALLRGNVVRGAELLHSGPSLFALKRSYEVRSYAQLLRTHPSCGRSYSREGSFHRQLGPGTSPA